MAGQMLAVQHALGIEGEGYTETGEDRWILDKTLYDDMRAMRSILDHLGKSGTDVSRYADFSHTDAATGRSGMMRATMLLNQLARDEGVLTAIRNLEVEDGTD